MHREDGRHDEHQALGNDHHAAPVPDVRGRPAGNDSSMIGSVVEA